VKPRHAAALALVGWYLMMPPMYESKESPDPSEERVKVGNKGFEVNPSAAFSDWQIDSSYDAAKQCQTARLALLGNHRKSLAGESYDLLETFRRAEAHCVASDDPRLREK